MFYPYHTLTRQADTNMKYKIEITRTEREEYEDGNDWKMTGNKKEDGGDEYGYTPKITMTKEVERTILIQEVDDIDLKGIIKAINGI